MPGQTNRCMHPLGVKPLGNALFDNNNPRGKSLGYFAVFDDQLLTLVLSKLGPFAMSKLSRISKYLYAFCYHDEIWREFVIALQKPFKFAINWRNTFKSLHRKEFVSDIPISFTGIYSDILYMYWRCSTVPLKEICGYDTINVDTHTDISMNDFVDKYLTPNKPCLLKGVMKDWKAAKWDFDRFNNGDFKFIAESIELTFDDYFQYMIQCKEEAPLYLFDKHSLLQSEYASDFKVPEYFGEDLFSLLGRDRPDYR